MTIKAIVFDMDGLLIDSEPIWQKSREAAFGAERLRWTEADQQAVMGSSTIGWATFVAERLDHEYPIEDVIERVLQQMETYYRQQVPLMPGARAVVEQLAAQYPVGLASGSPHRLITAALQGAGWEGLFEHAMSSDEVAHGKPAPDVYMAVAERMGIDLSTSAIFEDSANGILAGIAAGGKVIAVPSDYSRPADEILAQAALVLESLEDFSLDTLATL